MPQFLNSIFNADQLKKNNQYNEVCLLGRSNVGKSTLINALAKQKIAFTAKKAGKTRSLNFYDFHDYYLVDLPGYGYAAVNHQKSSEISALIIEYLSHRSELKGIIQICDLSILSQKDLEVFKEFTQNYENYLICLNKIDRYSHLQQQQFLQKAIVFFKIPAEKFLLISGKSGHNISKIKQILFQWSKK